MTSHDELVKRVRRVARVENDERARRWLTATCSLLSDWGGPAAASVLKESLPGECLSGKGSKGRDWAGAYKAAGNDARVALLQEAERRTHQPDPRNVAMMLLPILGIVKQEVEAARGASGVESLVSSMPVPVQEEIRAASAKAPFGYRLIPQSYARPDKITHS